METASLGGAVAISQKEDQPGGSAAQIQEPTTPSPPKKKAPKTQSKFRRILRRGCPRKLSPQPRASFIPPTPSGRLTHLSSTTRTKSFLPTPTSGDSTIDSSSPSFGESSVLKRRARDLKKADTRLHASLKKLQRQQSDHQAAIAEKHQMLETLTKRHAAEIEELRCGKESRRKAL